MEKKEKEERKKRREKKKSCTRDVAVYNLQVNAKRVEHSTKRKKRKKEQDKITRKKKRTVKCRAPSKYRRQSRKVGERNTKEQALTVDAGFYSKNVVIFNVYKQN